MAGRLAAPHVPPALPVPSGDAARARPLPAQADDPDGRGDRACHPGRRRDRRAPARPGLPRDRPGRVAGPPSRRDRSALRSGARDLAPSAARGLGARRRVTPRGRGTRPTGAGGRSSRGSARAGRPARSTGRRSPATRTPSLDHPWSIVVGHDGVFKVALLTLFDLPLDRFWMWSMDLCGITRHRVPCRAPGPARPQPDRAPRRPRPTRRATSRRSRSGAGAAPSSAAR